MMKKLRLYPNPKQMRGSDSAVYVATLLNPVDHRLYDVQRERFLNRIPRGEFLDKERKILELLGQQKLPFKEVAANSRKLKHSKAWAEEFSEFI